MILILIIILAFVILVGLQLIFWVSYIYSRFSKDLELEREFLRQVTRKASDLIIKRQGRLKNYKLDDDYKGYA